MFRTVPTALCAAALLSGAAAFAQSSPVVIGLITKTDTNPFFVKMKEGAEAEAKKPGAKLMTAAGKNDGDNAGQITAIENMVTAGAKTHPDHPPATPRPSCPADQEGPGQGRAGDRAGQPAVRRAPTRCSPPTTTRPAC